jgi:tetratricopeptide (TPR) repeat protein
MNNIYRDYAAMCPDFRQGIAFLAERAHEQALDAFARADISTNRDDVYKNKYQSFHGLLLLQSGQSKGIDLCRAAAGQECFDGDVFYNLACAELETGRRREAIQAIRRGLDIDATHPELIRLRQRLGMRRNVMFAFLGRDNPINRIIGKLTYNRTLRCFV